MIGKFKHPSACIAVARRWGMAESRNVDDRYKQEIRDFIRWAKSAPSPATLPVYAGHVLPMLEDLLEALDAAERDRGILGKQVIQVGTELQKAWRAMQEPKRIEPRLLSYANAAMYLGLAVNTLRNKCSSGNFPVKPKKLAGKPVFDRRELDAYLDVLRCER